MAEKFLQLDLTTGLPRQRDGLVQTRGALDAGRVVATDATGTLDPSLFPTGLGPDVQIVKAAESIGAGDFLALYNNGGIASCRKALAVDDTKRPHGFCLVGGVAGDDITLYVGGKNTKVARGSLTIADLGKLVFLSASTAGGITLTPPSAAGALYAPLGPIIEVGSTYVTINVIFGLQVTM